MVKVMRETLLSDTERESSIDGGINLNSDQNNDVDVSNLLNGIRRQLPWIVLSSAIASSAVFLFSRSQPDVFEASSSLVTTGAGSNISSLRDSLVTASPLPEGALQEAMRGPTVMGEIIRRVRTEKSLPENLRSNLSDDLQSELRRRNISTIKLDSQLDYSGNGIYTVMARAGSPEAAAFLADASVQALLNWDRGRALSGVQRAERSLRAQINEVDRQLAEGGQSDLQRQTLVASRANLQRSLAEAGIQAEGVSGFLDLVAPAVVPIDRVAPNPLRNAVLVGLLTFLVVSALAAVRTLVDRTARSEDDLLSFGLPTLGVIPRLRRREIVFNGIVRAARLAGLYESIGFLRVNILSRIGNNTSQRIMISSTAPGEGKSSLTATLADGLAASGQRVLIIDADMRRGTQQEVWDKYETQHSWVQLVGDGGGRNLGDALKDPSNVQVMEAEQGVHVLPAGPGMHDSLGLLNRVPLGQYFDQWCANYDLILIDSPPLLALADGLVIGQHVDHVLLVVEDGKTSINAIRQSLRRAKNANVSVLGFVMNKVSFSSQDQKSYSYGYSYAPRTK